MTVEKRKIPAVVVCGTRSTDMNDKAGAYVHEWAESGVRELTRCGRFQVISLFGKAATVQRIDSALRTVQRRKGLVVFYGHGCVNAECLFSCDNEGRHQRLAGFTPSNCNLLKNKIVYVVACHSAKMHGRRSVAHGARCYIGYMDQIVVRPEPAFSESVNAGLSVLADKQGCYKAWDAIRSKYRTYYRQYVRDKKTLAIALSLYINLDALAKPTGNSMAYV